MKTMVCIASGPSLTVDDCRLVSASGLPVIAVNSSWQAVLDCKYIFAGDHKWWQENHNTITSNARLWTVSGRAASEYGLNLFHSRFVRELYNSGQLAIEFAISRGATRVLLLGYDCSIKSGSHWHGDHQNLKNPTVSNTQRWHGEFLRLSQWAKNVDIINCSRETELTWFRREALLSALARSSLQTGRLQQDLSHLMT